MQPKRRALEATAAETYALVREKILPAAERLSACRSTTDLYANPLYQSLATVVDQMLGTPHWADFRETLAPARPQYRIVAWNIERGALLEGQLDALRTQEYLRQADVLLITEADCGMARSGNRMVAEVMARELSMVQVFAPCYIALGKGSGAERDAGGSNEFGLHGNALLSRYPIRDVRLIPLINGIDKMAHREKRLGQQTAIAAVIDFPQGPVEAVCVHLDANSTQQHRCAQMKHILSRLNPGLPVVLGGDWNTSTHNSSRALWSILGYCLRVVMGVDNSIRNHYLHPERWFERRLFAMLENSGFEHRRTNLPGEYTMYIDVNDPRIFRNLGEWVPAWCFAFIRWALRHHNGRCPMKLDWFATRGLRAENPFVLHDLRDRMGTPLSDHDPVGIDIALPSSDAGPGLF